MQVRRRDIGQQYRHRRGVIKVYTRNEVAQGESKVGMVEVSLSVYS